MFRGYIPRGNLTSGNFTRVDEIQTVNRCVMSCCKSDQCNVALIHDEICYHVACVSSELCMPFPSEIPEAPHHISLILVKPVSTDENWWELLNNAYEQQTEELNRDVLSRFMNDGHRTMDDDYISDMFMSESNYDYKKGVQECEIGVMQCPENEECVQITAKSRSGVCSCKEEFARDVNGLCKAPNPNEAVISSSSSNNSTKEKTSSIAPLKPLAISVLSKEVRLPENEVNLVAYVVPVAAKGQKYQYDWTSLKQPSGTNTIKVQKEEQLHLSKLSEGLYTFKVSVTSNDAFGETYANVTVLPPKRINQPPQVIINPPIQAVKLPNTGAVLDASGSKDDDGIKSWHWELQQSPLGYQPHLVDTPTLQLDNLNIPGNYTFKVTVTDTDQATNSSTANITVLKITDYPPEANAGPDVIIYLPHNKVTLNGNLSIDDRAIVTWEWTKSSSDADKAADMQDTRTPYLSLSNLEEGMYTFILKVTDSANQSSSSEVHVFVKPPTNKPPTADAGENITISLPQTWIVLDGNKSKDDNKIVSYGWEQIQGPSIAVINSVNISQPNVTSLTKGIYVFKLVVTDNNGNIASDIVQVTVNQNKNEQPKANAGGDLNVILPTDVISINGTKSHDDLAIVKWLWKREDTSLAIGNIVKGTEVTSILMLTNAAPGRYVFRLTVWDEQGLSDSDTVSLMVKEDPEMYQLVELTVEADSRRLTESQFQMLQAKLALLVNDGTKLIVRGLKTQTGTERAVIIFYIEQPDGKAVPATEAVHHLKQKITLDESILGFSVVNLQTTICQNQCSGHGVCNEQTRKCLCEAFWMQDLIKYYLGDGEADCKWSVLYVVVALICGTLTLVGLCWGCAWLCVSICTKRKRTKPQNYSLLGDSDEPPHYASGKNTISESDTDSDVLFESRNKNGARLNGDSLRNGVNKGNRNGFIKLGRRVKT